MQRIIIRHLSGSKANQVEEFPLNHFNELVFGRDPSSSVKYDPDRDDLVGRQHARIAPDPKDATQFTVTDLNSRNGTYVNKQRITDSTRIFPGDDIQLGPGGPQFQFDLEPRPANAVKPTRSVAVDPNAPTVQDSGTVPPTRQVEVQTPPTRSVNVGPVTGSTGTVGKATVERMISQNIAITKKTEGRKYMLLGGAALAAVVIVFLGVAGYLYSRSSASETQIGEVKEKLSTSSANAAMDSTAIAKANKSAVVKIDVSWKLISPQGGLVYHQYGCGHYPCFVELEDGTLEPLLSYDKERFGETSPAIGGKFSASGVVVSNDGFILTNRHVAAAWETPYEFPPEMIWVTVKSLKGKSDVYRNIKRDPVRWIPSETKQIITTLRGKERIKEGEFNGQNERLDVFFPSMMERNVAQLKKSHEDYDLSMIKVDLPAGLPKAELFDSLKDVKQGDAVFVMGYQRVSIPIYGYKQETSSRASQQKEIPDPNVVSGNIGRLILIQDSPTTRQKLLSEIGNAYQLSVSTQDPGYDGGPVFDNRGRVIGIYSLEKRLEVPTTVGIPIHYGLQLMSVADSSK